MKNRWKNVFIALAVVFILLNCASIVNAIATTISSAVGTVSSAFDVGLTYSSNGQSDAFNLARTCIFFIFVLGALKLITNRRR